MLSIIIVFALVAVLAAVNLVVEYRRMLMMLQQNSYRNDRFVRWLNTSADTTSMRRLIAVAVFFGSLVKFGSVCAGVVLMLLFFVCNVPSLVRRKYKKPLVWTNRVGRLFWTMTALSAAVVGVAVVCFASAGWPSVLFVTSLTLLALYALSALVAMAANVILRPWERAINRRYIADAARILRSMPDLKIVGITGSYGKTSTKHYLTRILAEHFDVCMTPGSFNTTMGVVRTVREHLKPYNEVFVVEMGAKQPGDIKEICDLVHPTTGIVTAVGEQHLESFKTIENVQRTKFELVDSLPADGLAVVNNDFPYIACRPVDSVAVSRYAVKDSPEVDYHVENLEYSPSGTGFTVVGRDGYRLDLHTKLVGECNVSNLVAAVIVARRLGVPDSKIRYAVEKIEQVEHRLNLKRTAGGVTIIDDAFNSNPTGSGMALDVLASMTGGRRIVITPGMIELGDKQEEYNRRFGGKIAESADVAIIVGRYNREAIAGGIADSGRMAGENVHLVDTFADAQRLFLSMARPGDTVLYENDLPDTFK